MLILEILSCGDIKKDQFQFLATVLVVFFWSLNCTNQVSISSHILNMGNILFESFYYLIFSVFKNLKFTFSRNFLVMEMLKFWSVNYICQVCKSCSYFGHVKNFGQYLYLSVFNKQCPTFSFICCVAILLKIVFFVLFGG